MTETERQRQGIIELARMTREVSDARLVLRRISASAQEVSDRLEPIEEALNRVLMDVLDTEGGAG